MFKYTWFRVNGDGVMEKALVDFIVVHKRVSRRVLDVSVLRAVSGGISDHYLVEGRLRVSERWRKQRSVESK